ncbi:MAG TPA: hypothetical protein VJ933_05315 [Phaeodactylibacter sp.]|nr:hypothetical protein [Phaeodactylibacter sp.]
MTKEKDYTQLSLEELIAEEKKIKRQDITGSVFVGFLVGVMLFGLIMNGFGLLYTAIPLLIIAAVAKNGQTIKAKLKELREEIDGRSGA